MKLKWTRKKEEVEQGRGQLAAELVPMVVMMAELAVFIAVLVGLSVSFPKQVQGVTPTF